MPTGYNCSGGRELSAAITIGQPNARAAVSHVSTHPYPFSFPVPRYAFASGFAH